MNGNDPVKSLYTTPSLLSANAPKQNTFAVDSGSSSPMIFALAQGVVSLDRTVSGPWICSGLLKERQYWWPDGWDRLGIVWYTWGRCNLWRRRCLSLVCCASNAVPGLLHVTFCGGGAWIEVLQNQLFGHVGATADKSSACCL